MATVEERLTALETWRTAASQQAISFQANLKALNDQNASQQDQLDNHKSKHNALVEATKNAIRVVTGATQAQVDAFFSGTKI